MGPTISPTNIWYTTNPDNSLTLPKPHTPKGWVLVQSSLFLFFSIEFSMLLFFFAFSIASTVASPVGDGLTLGQNDAARGTLANLNIFKESTDQPPSGTDDSQSTSQLFATTSSLDTICSESIENSVQTPQQPYVDSSANLGIDTSRLALPLSQKLALNGSPVKDPQSQSPGTCDTKPNKEDVHDHVPSPEPKPNCAPGLRPYCSYGIPYLDFHGNIFVPRTFPCRKSSSSYYLSPSQFSKYDCYWKTLIRDRYHRVCVVHVLWWGSMVLHGL